MTHTSEHDEGEALPRYPGEDTSPTSGKELFGFYAYSFAAEVFVVCGIGSFIPITLEQLARERGFIQSDRSKRCTAPSPLDTQAYSTYGFRHRSSSDHSQCVVDILGFEINTASFAMYTFSISVLLQAIVVVTMSGAADHGHYRKSLLLSFALIGAVSTMLFLAVTSRIYLMGALLVIIGNVCFGASFVLLNSFLPLMVRWHPSASAVKSRDAAVPAASHEVGLVTSGPEIEVVANSSTPLLRTIDPRPNDGHEKASVDDTQLSTRISALGIGIGYIAALFVQMFSIFIIISTGSTTFSLRVVLFTIGLWWGAFTLPAAMCLKARPGPPLETSSVGRRTWLGYITYPWINLTRTIMQARRLKDILLFLAAWFLISDAIATVSGTAILFAKTTLDMKPAALSLISVITTVLGIIGAFTWSKISRALLLTPSRTILACICIFEIIPLYGLLGFVPIVQRAGVGGLQQAWEMYPLGAVYGFVLGGLSSYCRSLFGELIPEGSEAAFYALYAVTDKGSSIFGPTVVGAITNATGEIRPAFWFLALLIGLPIPLVYLVDEERGKREGAALARASARNGPDEGARCTVASSEGNQEFSLRVEHESE